MEDRSDSRDADSPATVPSGARRRRRGGGPDAGDGWDRLLADLATMAPAPELEPGDPPALEPSKGSPEGGGFRRSALTPARATPALVGPRRKARGNASGGVPTEDRSFLVQLYRELVDATDAVVPFPVELTARPELAPELEGRAPVIDLGRFRARRVASGE